MASDLVKTLGGLRLDGRRPLELRKIGVKMGVFGQADGSAYLEQGKTKILAAVYGPHQTRGSAARSTVNKSTKGLVNCQYSMAVFSLSSGERKKRPRGDRKTQERSIQLRHAMEAILNLENFPRSQIDIFVEVLQVDGSDYCAAINAATLALIDAGIPIKDYAIGCTVTLPDASQSYDQSEVPGIGVLDANNLEENGPGTTLSVVALPETKNEASTEAGLIIVAQASGQRLDISKMEGMKIRALHGCQNIKTILDKMVRQHLTTNSLPSLFDVQTLE
ncbi:exosome complex component RRP41 [Diachasmimorpha longicaudata]|uniref:exosome complex component RRP41 n=1 Tax=Diachasmimorpha longicaudata TaxID=58733 RepID=UPI0030B91690